MTNWLHGERLEAVQAAIRTSRARSVLDLGCGDGDLFLRLAAEPGIARLVGIDVSAAALTRLRARLARAEACARNIELRRASLTEPDADLAGFDCAALVEVLEHIDPSHLSQLERAVFVRLHPMTVVVTTPNAEFNPLLGVPGHRFRHRDHRFEWTRGRFRSWAGRVAATTGYVVTVADIAGRHPDLGGASQLALFQKAASTKE